MFCRVPSGKEGEESFKEDLESDLETEGIHSLEELVKDTLYLSSCSARGIVPISCIFFFFCSVVASQR